MPLPPPPAVALDAPPYRLSGVVYGALLNHAPLLAALGDAVHQPPYKAPPRAPVLAVKPRNTLAGDGSAVAVPAGLDGLRVEAQLGLVVGRSACRVAEADALDHLAGVLLVLDFVAPHDSHYRPAVRQRALDGSCVLGGRVLPLAALPGGAAALDDLTLQRSVDGAPAQAVPAGARVRGAARLLAEVSAFMTLSPGDVLLMGSALGAPLLRPGQAVVVQAEGLGRVEARLQAEAATSAPPVAQPGPVPTPSLAGAAALQPTARVAVDGAVHSAVPHPQGLQLADGRVLAEDQVVWLPPFEVGSILALGLNYADHVKELARELTVTAQDEPLVFLKGPGALVGHRGHTPRPLDAAFMHYECELAVVIGRTARQVPAERAMDHVAGYTVANDYAVRDYLENWYRPNLRVKNRDRATALGPWLVPAAAVADPHALGLRTFVNGRLTQQGSTAQMVHRIPALIAWLSSFMTLQPGDVLLTGTPDGVVNVNPGDEVVCEIDGIGRLVNTLVADPWPGPALRPGPPPAA